MTHTVLQDALAAAANRATTDDAYLFRLIDNPAKALAEMGFALDPSITVEVLYEEFRPLRFRIDFSRVPRELADHELDAVSAGGGIFIWEPVIAPPR